MFGTLIHSHHIIVFDSVEESDQGCFMSKKQIIRKADNGRELRKLYKTFNSPPLFLKQLRMQT